MYACVGFVDTSYLCFISSNIVVFGFYFNCDSELYIPHDNVLCTRTTQYVSWTSVSSRLQAIVSNNNGQQIEHQNSIIPTFIRIFPLFFLHSFDSLVL